VQWLTLTVWILVAALALPLSRGAIYGRVSLGAQAIVAMGGLALSIVVCTGGAKELAWWALGCGAMGILAMGAASVGLTAEREGTVAVEVELMEEHEAVLAGVQLLLMGLVTILSGLVALEVGLAS
jgi:hypothetical protein